MEASLIVAAGGTLWLLYLIAVALLGNKGASMPKLGICGLCEKRGACMGQVAGMTACEKFARAA